MPSTEQKHHYTAAEWSSFADNELPAPMRAEMQAHLAECAECRALARSYDAVQRGAAHLAQTASPPSPALRTRVLTIGSALIELEQMRWFWVTVIAVGIFAAAVLGGVWFALRQEPTPAIVNVAESRRVAFAVDRLAIEEYLLSSGLVYEVTIENRSGTTLEIRAVHVRDPFGEFQRPFEPSVTLSAGAKLSRYPFPTHQHLAHEDGLRDGIYRIEITTNLGSFSAERVILSPERR